MLLDKTIIQKIRDNSITILDLNGRQIENAETKELAEALKDNKSITHFALQINHIENAETKELAEALKINHSITHLDLRDNNIGNAGAKELAEALKDNKSITHLNLQNNYIGKAGAKELAEALKDNKSITHLNLQNNYIGEAGAKELAEALKDNKSITHLNLQRNNIGDAEAKSLAECLKDNKSITHLDLQRNNIGDAGAKELAEALKINHSITHLDLQRNNIGNVGAKSLAECLKDNKSITTLQLDSNQIGEAGAKELAEALKDNKSITTLQLGSNQIGDAGVKSLAECLKVNKSITHLDIQFNNIGDAGAKELVEALENNTTLTTLTDLNLQCTNIAPNLKADIEMKLQRNKQIKISESFKAIISKITLGTDGTPLLSWDEEGSDQNSVFNKFKEYNEEYGEFPITVLEQIIAQSIYQNTVHVYQDGTEQVCQDGTEQVCQDGIEQLSFAAKLDALIKVTQTLLERLEFNKEIVNEFNSKIADIINEVKEMFMLELDILNADNASAGHASLLYYESDNISKNFTKDINRDANKQLDTLYKQFPDLKMPGTILRKLLESDSIYDNIARQLKDYADAQTFKHNPPIQKLLDNFADKLPNLGLESSLVSEQNESPEGLEQTSNNIHLSDTSDTQSVPMMGNTDYGTEI